jgi:serine protease Do
VPMVFRRSGEVFDVLVRLRGVHGEAELAELVQSGPKIEPDKAPEPKPGDPPKDAPKKTPPRRQAHAKPEPMPEIVKQHFLEKTGYVNYYFNQLERDRVWKALVARGDYAALAGAWTLSGETATGEEIRFEISDALASIKLPSGELIVELEGDLAARLDPPGSGGLLVSLAMWRRFLLAGPAGFGEVTYWGTAPVEGRERLADVLVGTYRDLECRFLCDSVDGQLVAMEMLPEEDTDPCELHFSDFREVEGRIFPHKIEVRHGDGVYQIDALKEIKIAPVTEKLP